ncbi:hypothetical protein [uncultured Lamprocystis sp.]|uniref:hypothetical protein n=1 Tax=uncultured Lamprocystis sp. TaxID=543132 RepID=UPI0025D0CDF7|nr:hypothetical protein [uncultured Lamprocystis sp.]
MTKRSVAIILAAAIVVGLLAALIAVGGEPFAERVAERIYPDLQRPFDSEAPPTPTSLPASSEIRTVIGGKGEGLSCSLEPWMERLFFSRDQQHEAPLSLQIRQACAFHDYCYRHGDATYGYQQVDCDFMLQQYAYRLCRQISQREESHNKCMSRARRVLLGVRVGGGQPEAGRSTFFEFDPMPHRADDYVVGRLVSLPEKQPVVGSSGKAFLRQSLVTYAIKRGTVQPRLLTWDPCRGDNAPCTLWDNPLSPKEFPNRAIPTPPHVVSDAGRDRVLAMVRDEIDNTGVRVVEYPVPPGNSLGTVDPPIDHDASINLLHTPGSGIEILSVSHRGTNGAIQVARDTWRDNGHNVSFISVKQQKDRYRILQIEPIVGRFQERGQEDILLIRRGLDSRGERYQEAVRGYVASLDQPASQRELRIELPEGSEPAGPVKLPDGRDGLISVVAKKNQDTGQPETILEVRDVMHCDEDGSCGAPTPIDTRLPASWIRMPVQVLPSRELPESDLLFFSRVVCRKANDQERLIDCADIPAPEHPTEVVIEFFYSRLTGGSDQTQPRFQLLPVGDGSCRIPLEQQLQAQRKNNDDRLLVRKIKRALIDKTDREKPEKVNPYVFREFARRWSNSQVIPGRIFDRDGTNTPADVLDVAMIFKGDPGFSLLLRGEQRTAPKTYRLAAFSPGYMYCE